MKYCYTRNYPKGSSSFHAQRNIFQERVMQRLSQMILGTRKEWALKFVSCKCIFLNLLVADGLMYSRWFWDMRYKSNFGVFGVLLPILYYLLDANSIHKIHITPFTWLEKQACFNLDCSSDAVSFFNDNVLHLIPLTSWFHPLLLQLVYFWQKSF